MTNKPTASAPTPRGRPGGFKLNRRPEPVKPMKINLTSFLVAVALTGFVASSLPAAEEQDLMGVLQSTAGAPQKWAACQKLRIIGTAESVPALAGLLIDERLSQAARHTLEAMPFLEAGSALRDALPTTSGLIKAGIIDSLGWRGEPESVPILSALLSDSDGNIASSAAAALGRIGGPDAAAALLASCDQAASIVQPAIQEALLKCAEKLLGNRDAASAVNIYRRLVETKYPPQIRAGSWRGLAISDSAHRTELVGRALASTDQPIHLAALKVVREVHDAQLTRSCLANWASLPLDSQLAVLDASLSLGAEALPTIRTASQSPQVSLRVAAWQAFADANDPSALLALARAAARGEPSEREAARETLARVRGPGMREALLAELKNVEPPEKAELLRALGERGDNAASQLLLENADADAEPVRQAALESLSRLAVADTIAPLLTLAAGAKSDAQRVPVLKALYAVCEASPNKDETARSVIKSINHVPAAERVRLLPLLGELGTSDALSAAQSASRDADPELAKAGVRALSQWPNAAAATPLLELARGSTDPTLQTLALRGCIEVAGQEPDPGRRLATLEQAMAAANRPEEKKQALAQIGQIPTPQALEVLLKDLSQPGLENEAALAAVNVAEKLAPANPQLADRAASKVLDQCKSPEIVKRAWALRLKPQDGGSFIRNWLVSGPYRQDGVVGALAIFNVPFSPEKPGERAEWKPAPAADHVNLSALFPNQENCAAYLKTEITAPDNVSCALLIGSDDGVKAWLNGEVVHSNNIDRGELADQDTAPIKLKKGINQLMLKISQGGGGWSACARIVGSDGKPVPGLRVEVPQPGGS